MPLLIPLSDLEKEKDHIKGFSPEVYTITKIGNKEINEHYIIRPTSEIIFCEYFRNILNSYKDLPIKLNQ
jgi:prolyl-tRNA synthetase